MMFVSFCEESGLARLVPPFAGPTATVRSCSSLQRWLLPDLQKFAAQIVVVLHPRSHVASYPILGLLAPGSFAIKKYRYGVCSHGVVGLICIKFPECIIHAMQ